MKLTVSPEIDFEPLDSEEIYYEFSDVGGYGSLEGFLSGLDSVLIVMNDCKRNTPTNDVLGYFESYLENVGVLDGIHFDGLVATGSHSPPSKNEVYGIAGGLTGLPENTYIHKARSDRHVDIGVTSRGTPVLIDELVGEYDRVICINSVEPHYFAGYTGGRKSIVPGVSHWKTIETNHSNALSSKSQVLKLSENPVHLDMVEACEMAIDRFRGDFLGINLVASEDEIFGLDVGSVNGSFNNVIDIAEKAFTADIDRENGFDIVISKVKGALSKNLYQSLKGFENGKNLCKDGGSLILVSSCEEGIGPDEFYRRMKESSNPSRITREIEKNYSLGSHKTYNLLKFLKNHEVYIVSGLQDKIVRDCFCKPADSIKDAYNSIKKEKEETETLIIEDAGNLVPKLNQN